MSSHSADLKPLGYCRIFLSLAFLCFLTYSNTFDVPWQFDDHPNILHNAFIHVEQASPASFFQALFTPSEKGELLRRPVSNLTFAINWYFGGKSVAGYHFVNLSIHILNAYFLFLTVILLFRTPNLRQSYRDFQMKYFVAVLTALLWALHPIQTQAVTYLVQRMASLATGFFILGICFYLKGRMTFQKELRYGLYFLCMISYALAVGSKENAVTLPLLLLVIEILFFQDLSDPKKRKFLIWGILLAGIFFLVSSFIIFNVFLQREISSIFSGYERRPFTLFERLMTQPRVLVFYLTLIFYPIAGNLSLMHDFPVSTSLFIPWTTLPAILLLLFVIGFGIYNARRWPILSFAILFYFLNHILESTVIPLEMVYEHRNYLPSLFLFMPVSIGIWKILEHFRLHSPLRFVLIATIILILINMGFSTYSRNEIWTSEASLWEDTYKKASRLARPAHNLGEIYSKAGQYQKAIDLYTQALNGVDMRGDQKALTYYNMGNIFHRLGKRAKAVELYRKALEGKPGYPDAQYNLTLVLVDMGFWDEAVKNIHQLVTYYPGNVQYNTLKGAILLKTGKIDTAITPFKAVLKINPFNSQAKFYLGVAYHLSGHYQRADQTLLQAVKRFPDNIYALLWLIENRVKIANRDRIDNAIQMLFNRFSVNRIQNALLSSDNPFLPALSESPSLSILLGEMLKEKAEIIQKQIS